MYLKINQSVKKPWHRPSMGVALFRVMCSWHRAAVPTVSAHVTWCSWLFFAVFDCIFQNPLCCWRGRTQGRTEKTTVCMHLTVISNKMTNILEVSQFCYSGREKKKQESLIFFPGWALKSFVLYTNQIIASQLRGKDDFGQKKSHYPSTLTYHLFSFT